MSPVQFIPHDKALHKPLNISQFLSRKLRWLTLGGQYDWTAKRYSDEKAPSFPKDLAGFVHTLFPRMKPEAAIVNVYSPGDTLSIHRDVSEECDSELVSISFGCDGIFVVGVEHGQEGDPDCLIVRLHSGDAVTMSGVSLPQRRIPLSNSMRVRDKFTLLVNSFLLFHYSISIAKSHINLENSHSQLGSLGTGSLRSLKTLVPTGKTFPARYLLFGKPWRSDTRFRSHRYSRKLSHYSNCFPRR